MKFIRKELDRESYEMMLAELNALYQISEQVAGGVPLNQAVSTAPNVPLPSGSMVAVKNPTTTTTIGSQSTQQQIGGATPSGVSALGAIAPGERILDYTIAGRLGRGGMGMVFKAEGNDGKIYALKLFPGILSGNPREMARVNKTFEAVRKLNHPNIAQVYKLEEHPLHGLVLVMEYCEGVTLDEYVENIRASGSSVTIGEVCRVLSPVAVALDYAHAQLVIHRDIKPQNIMLKSDGSGVKLIDFGLADQIRTSMVSVSNVSVGEISGTRAYMASEQWQGHVADGKTDQYALACVAYEMLAGHPPFLAGEPAVLERCHRTEQVPPIENCNALVNAVFWIDDPLPSDTFALAKKRAQRFSNCVAFIETLREREPEQSSYPPTWRVFGTRAMSHQAQVSSSVSVSDGRIFATADVSGSIIVWDLGTRQAIRRVKIKSGVPMALAVSGNARSLFIGTDVGQIAQVDLVTGRLVRTVPAGEAPIMSLACGGEHLLAAGGGDGVLRLFTETDLQPFTQTESTGVPITALTWSPSGLLAWGESTGHVTVVSTDSDSPVAEYDAHRGAVTSLKFSRENRSLVSAGEDGCIHSLSLAGRHKMHSFIQGAAKVLSLDFLPGSDRFVAILADGKCYTFELYKHVQVSVASAVNARGTASCFLSGRTMAVVGEQSGLLRLVNLDRHSEVISGQSYLYPLTGIEIIEDKGLLLTAHASGELIMWDLHTQKMVQRRMLSDGAIQHIGLVTRDYVLAMLHRDGNLTFSEALTNKRITAERLALPPRVTALSCHALTTEMLLGTGNGEVRAIAWPVAAMPQQPYSEEIQYSCFEDQQDALLLSGDRFMPFRPEEGRTAASVTVAEEPVRNISYHTRQGYMLAITQSGLCRTFDLRARQGIARLEARNGQCGCFSPDGTMVAVGSTDGQVFVMHVEGGVFASRDLHRDQVNGITFSQDGRQVISASRDGTIRLWRYAENKPPATFVFKSAVTALRLMSNGSLLAGLEDGTTVMTATVN